jgi:hypothetical protein
MEVEGYIHIEVETMENVQHVVKCMPKEETKVELVENTVQESLEWNLSGVMGEVPLSTRDAFGDSRFPYNIEC